MQLEDWLPYIKKKPFWRKLKELVYTQERVTRYEFKTKEDDWYSREHEGQIKRLNALYVHLYKEYETLEKEHDFWKKRALIAEKKIRRK